MSEGSEKEAILQRLRSRLMVIAEAPTTKGRAATELKAGKSGVARLGDS